MPDEPTNPTPPLRVKLNVTLLVDRTKYAEAYHLEDPEMIAAAVRTDSHTVLKAYFEGTAAGVSVE